MKPVRYSARARADLDAIGRFIARDNPARGPSFKNELRQRCLSLGEHHFQGRPVPEFGVDARCLTFRRYVILYRVLADFIAIDRILHTARDLRALLAPGDDE